MYLFSYFTYSRLDSDGLRLRLSPSLFRFQIRARHVATWECQCGVDVQTASRVASTSPVPRPSLTRCRWHWSSTLPNGRICGSRRSWLLDSRRRSWRLPSLRIAGHDHRNRACPLALHDATMRFPASASALAHLSIGVATSWWLRRRNRAVILHKARPQRRGGHRASQPVWLVA